MDGSRIVDAGDEGLLFSEGYQGRLATIAGDQVQWQSVMDSRGRASKAQAITIQIGPPEIVGGADPGVNDATDVLARLRWGVSGVSMQCELDVVRGTKINLVCDQFDIAVRMDVGVAGAQALTIPVIAGYGTVGIGQVATRTIRFGAVLSGATTAAVRIPEQATRLRVYRNTQLAIRIDVLDAALAIIMAEAAALNAAFPTLDLPVDSCWVQLTNLSGTTNLVNARLVFELAL